MTWWRELSRGLGRPMLVVGCVFLAFMLSVAAMSTLLGAWPPFMAVESRSMQHSDNSSAIGIIDTGDVVVVSALQDSGGVRTYIGSMLNGYHKFGEYGDVIVYQAPGEDVPIVHRAFCNLVYNFTAEGFDIPELASLPNGTWASTDGGWQGLTGWVEVYHVGYADVTVYIDLHEILGSMDDNPHSGLITMGDNNWKEIENERFGVVDQGNLVKEPIRPEWVIGKVVGEIPWIGTIRLWITGTMPPYMPVNSIVMLVAFLTSIAALPAALWLSARALEHRRGGS